MKLGLHPLDLRLQHLYPRVELLDRQRIEILLRQELQRIVRLVRKELVEIHWQSVDRSGGQVNKRASRSGGIVAELPREMKAIDPAGAGGPEVLEIVARPVPRPATGEVLIKVAAAGINRPDVLQRRGLYPPPPGAPSIPGLEISGEIVAMGQGVQPELAGQPVCALVAGGGYAEYCVAPAGQCLTVPEALSMIEAAAMPETLFTIWTNLFERAFAKEGEWVLVHGGTSGIGTMAIALGRL